MGDSKENRERKLDFIDYINSDKSLFPRSSKVVNTRTDLFFVDKDDDFLVGDSGGFLMNMNFKFIDTYKFSECALAYERNKKDPNIVSWVEGLDIKSNENRNRHYYCPYLSGSPEFNKFWSRETERRNKGLTLKCKLLDSGKVVNLRITGDHYNYLNYGRIMRTPSKEERRELDKLGKTKVRKVQGFPRFWDGDYWNFKVDEFVTNNDFHLCKAKARRKGYSFKRGSQGANTINSTRDITIILAAYDLSYLIDQGSTADMLKVNLDWYEDNTYWKRFYLSEQLTNIELGYKKKSEQNKKYGFRSKALSVTIARNASAAIGKDAIEIDLEEAGKCLNLQDFLNVTLSSTEAGAGKVGTLRVYGTGGAKEADWEGFSTIYYDPTANDMMPFENVWDKDARGSLCGFFHAQIMNMEPFMDKDGNSLYDKAWDYDYKDKEKKKLSLPAIDYAVYVGQRANRPEEAFKNTNENIFASIELDDHIKNVKYNPQYKYYRDGMFYQKANGTVEFRTNEHLELSGTKTHPYIEDYPFRKGQDIYGCVREFYPPYKEADIIPNNLYYISIDPVAMDKESGLITNKHSLNSFHVMMYPNNISNTLGDIIVASYCGRPEKMEDVNRMLLLACKRYNAKCLAEVDRGQVVHDFRKWKELKWLYKDPIHIIDEKLSDKQSSYGIIIGSKGRANEGLIYLKDWLYTKVGKQEDNKDTLVLHYIRDLPTLIELQKFNLKGNFDRISSLRVAMFQRSAFRIKRLKAKSIVKESIYDRIGLYYKNKR